MEYEEDTETADSESSHSVYPVFSVVDHKPHFIQTQSPINPT